MPAGRPASIGEARRALPPEFVSMLSDTFPQSISEMILRGTGARRRTTLRVNTLRSSAEELRRFFKERAVKHARPRWCDEAFILAELRERDVERWEFYQTGRIYLQSLSSMIPALALDPQPGEQVLDIAAAPGSKTTQMAALMRNEGCIVANEIDRIRAERLAYNVRLQGCANVEVRIGRGEKAGTELPGCFDRVLLDVPCSGEGRFLVGEPSTSRRWSPREVADCAKLQRKLLASGAACLKPGGVLVYSTCTLNTRENEEVVQWGLDTLPLEIQKIPLSIGGSYAGLTRGFAPAMRNALRLFPSEDMEGFFVCRMRKTP